MFSSPLQLVRRSGKKGVDRPEFIQELVNEFYQSSSLESQEQVLANLANFAYDPLNYSYLREARAIELFIEGLKSINPYFVQFSLKGLCNLSNDPVNQEVIIRHNGLDLIKDLLQSKNCELVKDTLTVIIFFSSSAFASEVKTLSTLASVRGIAGTTEDCYIKNLAQIAIEAISRDC